MNNEPIPAVYREEWAQINEELGDALDELDKANKKVNALVMGRIALHAAIECENRRDE